MRDLVGVTGEPTDADREQVIRYKKVVYDAFLSVWERGGKPPSYGILVDEEFGADIIADTRARGITLAVPVEKSGENVFSFEYGERFGEHIARVRPDFVKVLVRYHPANRGANRVQLSRLAKLSSYCREHGFKLLFELLVPATDDDLALAGGRESYDTGWRWERTRDAITEIKERVDVDTWKIEGVEADQWPAILTAIGPDAGVIVLGRGQDDTHVFRWLTAAAKHPQVNGFAIGRTVFFDALVDLSKGVIDRDEAVRRIAAKYEAYIGHWGHARSAI